MEFSKQRKNDITAPNVISSASENIISTALPIESIEFMIVGNSHLKWLFPITLTNAKKLQKNKTRKELTNNTQQTAGH